MAIIYEGELHDVVDLMHVTPGNWRGMVQAKLRLVKSGNMVEHRFGSKDSVEVADVDTAEVEYLYDDAHGVVVMDTTSYEQFTIPKFFIEDKKGFLTSNLTMNVKRVESIVVGVGLPSAVILEVTDTEPALKGATVTNVYKAAKVSTGLEVQVPPFIKIGDKVKVSTEDGKYLERAK
ncbi:MAG: elongation factor P [Planctomycetota bacterium]